jgi:PhnB protein
MSVVPYLNFNGQCREAFELYKNVFGGEIVAMFTHAETPAAEHVGPESQDLIMHARLVAGDITLMASDAPPHMYTRPAGIWVSVMAKDKAEGQRIFSALAEGGEVEMPYEETFWADGFGMTRDRFGIPWMINAEKPMG